MTLKHAFERIGAGSALLLCLLVLPFPTPASAVTSGAYSAYATSTLVHADAVRSETTRLVDAEVSYSGAALSSNGFSQTLRNEVGRPIVDAAPGVRSGARGSAVEAGVAVGSDADNQVIVLGKAYATAPGGMPDARGVGPLSVPPVAWATAVRGTADALYEGECVLGPDATRGTAAVADAEVLTTSGTAADGQLINPIVAIDAPNPHRATVSSLSRNRFVAQVTRDGKIRGANAGLMSETRQTFLPVTLLAGTPNEITIEVLGEWVLRAVALGVNDGAWVHYGPADVSPETPILRIIRAGVVTNVLTSQQLLGSTGRNVTVPGVGEISIGEDARAIGGGYGTAPTAKSNGTIASAAVDVVRVRLVPASGVADVRVGHMEAAATVPAGGIPCGLPVTKKASRPSVPVGEKFSTAITVANPYDCELRNLTIGDAITTQSFARYAIDSARSGTYSGADASGTLDWGVGRLGAHRSHTVDPSFQATDGPGDIDDTATARATCGVAAATGSTVAQVAVTGSANTTVKVTPGTFVLGKKTALPATGSSGLLALFVGVAAIMLGRAIKGTRFEL